MTQTSPDNSSPGGRGTVQRHRPRDLEMPPKRDHRSTEALENHTERRGEQAGHTEVVTAGEAHTTKQASLVRRMQGSRVVIFVALLLGVAMALGVVAWAILGRGDTSSQKISTVAVLPFRPIDSGSRDESLEMGVAETLITRLGSIGQVTVRPLNSVKKFAESDVDPVAAGQESQADAVLTGSLQKAGDRIRVNVRLVDVRTGNTLWTEKFDETFTDIFKVQDAIAERAANALKLQLSASDRERLAKRYTENSEAYQLYLQGRSLYHRRLGNWSDESMGSYTRALEKDPNFALAHVALADVLVSRHFGNKISYDEMLPQVKEHLAKAFQLDDALAEAYSLSGAVKYQYEYDWDGAGHDFQRAVELDPGSSQVRLDYAFFLLCLARFDEAFAQLDKAQEIEPDSLTIRAVRGNFLWHAHRDDEAIKYLEDFTKVVPDRGATYLTLADLYRRKGRDAESIEAALRGGQLRGRPPDEINRIADAYRRDGWKGFARAEIANMNERSRTQRVRTMDFVSTYGIGGYKDNALKYLEKAIEEHDPLVAQSKVNPLMDPLRDDPRLAQLLRKINLEP
jgi:TolB-like protein/Tfp pilus assembly protein PilF